MKAPASPRVVLQYMPNRTNKCGHMQQCPVLCKRRRGICETTKKNVCYSEVLCAPWKPTTQPWYHPQLIISGVQPVCREHRKGNEFCLEEGAGKASPRRWHLSSVWEEYNQMKNSVQSLLGRGESPKLQQWMSCSGTKSHHCAHM